MVVVDDLDEGLELAALLLAALGHAASDLGRVTLDAGNDGVAEGVRLVAVVDGLDNDNLYDWEEKKMLVRWSIMGFFFFSIGISHSWECA